MARTFSSALAPLVSARGLGLLGIDLLPPAKHLFARQFMGLVGKQPRLARGVKLIA
jgi:2-octaprenyl-6-methoxyphenol hydroxylase